MKGTILGRETRRYPDKNTGEIKTARTLYVAWDTPKHPVDGFEGQKCEAVHVPFEYPEGVVLHARCDFEYEVQQTRSGAIARLVDIIVIEKMAVTIKPITDAHNK